MAKEPLHDILCGILKTFLPENELMDGRCCFQPPADIQLRYPCIVYDYTNDNDVFADNKHYIHSKRYTVTIIDEDPDSKIPSELIDKLPYCTSDRNFDSEGLSHFVYVLFYNGPRIKEENQNE